MIEYHLVTTYYYTSEEARALENLECLRNNIDNPVITKIHLFLQGQEKPDVASDKVVFVKHNRRPMFSELFGYANSLPEEVIKVVANSDIYFNNTLIIAMQALSNVAIIPLTRWDRYSDGTLVFYNNPKSQDTWIFRQRIPDNIGNYFIGQHGCDIRLLYEMKQIGLGFANYSWDIVTIHLHQSGLRSYFKDPDYVYVKPPFEFALPVYLKPSFSQIVVNRDYCMLRYRFFRAALRNSHYGKNYSICEKITVLPQFFFWYLIIKVGTTSNTIKLGKN